MNECGSHIFSLIPVAFGAMIGLIPSLIIALVAHRLSLDRGHIRCKEDARHRLLMEIEKQRFLLNGEFRFKEAEFVRMSRLPLTDAVCGFLSRLDQGGGFDLRKAWGEYDNVKAEEMSYGQGRAAYAMIAELEGRPKSYREKLLLLLNGIEVAARATQ